MANVDLARIQFAFLTINHFFFVPATIGLAFLTVLPRPAAPQVRPRLSRMPAPVEDAVPTRRVRRETILQEE